MKNLNWSTAIIFIILLSSCGGGGGVSVTTTPVVGYVVDAPVQGLTYSCGALTGTTGSDGSFLHDSGAACTFKIGNVTVGAFNSAPTDGVVTPHDLAGVSRGDSLNPSAVAIAQFLQSLDDGTGSGRIKIPDSVVTALSGVPAQKIVDGTTTLSQNALTNLVSTATNNTKNLVTAATAGAAMNTYIQNTYPLLDTNKGAFVSKTANTDGVPTLIAPPPLTLTTQLNTLGLTATTDISANGYYVVLPASASAPNKWQIVAGTDSANKPVPLSGSFGMSAGTAATQTISGLSFSTDYKVYFVATNASQTSKITDVAKSSVSTGAEPQAPNLTTSVTGAINPSGSTASFSISSDVASIVYWVALPSSANAPNASNVIAAQDASNSSVKLSGNTSVIPGTSQVITISGLNFGGIYKVYVVGRNQADATKISQLSTVSVATRNQFLYLIDEQQTGAILVYKIGSDGDLTYISKTTTSSENLTSEIVFTPDGKYAYFISNPVYKEISQFKVETDGSLTAIGNSTVTLNGIPSSIAIENSGKSIFARIDRLSSDNSTYRNLVQFSIESNGKIKPTGTILLDFSSIGDSNYCELKGVDIDPIGNNLYATCRVFSVDAQSYVSYIYQFKVDSNGNATPLSPAKFKIDSFKVDTNSTVISPDGKFLYLLNADNGSVYQFSIDSSGKLLPLSPSLTSGSTSVSVRSYPIISTEFNEFYSLNWARFSINSDGTLSKNNLTIISGVDAAFSSDGKFLFNTKMNLNGKIDIKIYTVTKSTTNNSFTLLKTINTNAMSQNEQLSYRKKIKIN